MDATRVFGGLLLVTCGVAVGIVAVRAYRRYRVLEEQKLLALDRVLASQERLIGIVPLRVIAR